MTNSTHTHILRFKLFSFFLITFASFGFGQYSEITLEDKVQNSDLILEGNIISQFTYEKDENIYTASKLEVCDVIYDINSELDETNEIYIISFGGNHESKYSRWSHVLMLQTGYEGLFFLKKNDLYSPTEVIPEHDYYTVFGEEQGFIAYVKDDLSNFEGISLFNTTDNIEGLISDINNLTGQNLVESSCILKKKSGLILKTDSLYFENNQVIVETSLKGQWSKNYPILNINLDISSNTDLSNSGLIVSTLNPFLENNYEIEVITSNDVISIEITLSANSSDFFIANSDFQQFLRFSFSDSFFSFDNDFSINLLESSYVEENEVFPFEEFELNSSNIPVIPRPGIEEILPKDACAGIKADKSSGDPELSGYVIIKGSGFHDLSPSSFPTKIPNDYRVEFIRSGVIGTNAFKITPLPEDYEYWTDSEIKVRVPTAGWEVTNDRITGGPFASAVAVSGRVEVRNPDGADHSDDDKVTIRFAQFNEMEMILGSNKSLENKLFNRSNNGGYYFVFDDSFNNIYPSNPQAARQDVIDAFCEWNLATMAQLEVVETCPPNSIGRCYSISYDLVQAQTSSGTVALAAGDSNPNQSNCPGESVVGSMSLIFNDEIKDWKPVNGNIANPLLDKHIIRTAAYHEIGHLLQLGHVHNDGATMHPFYGNTITIDDDAIAGGTHVSEVSFNSGCTAPLISGTTSNCKTNSTISSNEPSNFEIFPNPTDKSITIKVNAQEEVISILIYDAQGKPVYSEKGKFLSKIIDTDDYLRGLYSIVVKTNKGIEIQKFIKL